MSWLKVPFFINSARLRTAESYFRDNYRPDELYKFDLEHKEDEDIELETNAKDEFHRVPSYICLKSFEDINQIEDPDEIIHPKLSHWMGLSLVWTALKRIYMSFRFHMCKRNNLPDLEAHNPPFQLDVIAKQLISLDQIEKSPPSEPNVMEIIPTENCVSRSLCKPSLKSHHTRKNMLVSFKGTGDIYY